MVFCFVLCHHPILSLPRCPLTTSIQIIKKQNCTFGLEVSDGAHSLVSRIKYSWMNYGMELSKQEITDDNQTVNETREAEKWLVSRATG